MGVAAEEEIVGARLHHGAEHPPVGRAHVLGFVDHDVPIAIARSRSEAHVDALAGLDDQGSVALLVPGSKVSDLLGGCLAQFGQPGGVLLAQVPDLAAILAGEGTAPADSASTVVLGPSVEGLADDDLGPFISQEIAVPPAATGDLGEKFVPEVTGLLVTEEAGALGGVGVGQDTAGEAVDGNDVDAFEFFRFADQASRWERSAARLRVNVVSRMARSAPGSRFRASALTRCRATTVFPVPGPPVTRAGPV